jgi:hypothetical protein
MLEIPEFPASWEILRILLPGAIRGIHGGISGHSPRLSMEPSTLVQIEILYLKINKSGFLILTIAKNAKQLYYSMFLKIKKKYSLEK